MKKFGVLFLLPLLLVSSFVSAQSISDNVEGFLGDITSAVYPVLKYFLGSTADAGASPEQILVKFLVFVLVFVFAAAGAKKIPLLEESPASSFIVAAIIAIIGVRFITTPELINLIWLPTSTFTVALTSIIPFILFFFIIEGFDSSILRKFGWTTYLVIFLYFAISRWSDPTLRIGGTSATGAWIYLIIAAVSATLIFADRKIHAIFWKSSFNKIADRTKRLQAIDVAAEIDGLYAKLAKARTPVDRSAVEAEIRNKEAALKALYQ